MTDGPIAKKFRIWNPALPSDHLPTSENLKQEDVEDHDSKNGLHAQDEDISSDEKPLDCTSKNNSPFPFPEVFQNYLQLAPLMLRLQQQRQLEEFARRQFLSQLLPVPPQISKFSTSSNSTSSSSSSSSSSTSTSSKSSGVPLQMSNPIVATALGSSLVNENCCAVCGAAFRLTGDLVQHMRNNHRKSKFKRKADFRQ